MEATTVAFIFFVFDDCIGKTFIFWTIILDDYGKQVVQRCTEVHPTGGWT